MLQKLLTVPKSLKQRSGVEVKDSKLGLKQAKVRIQMKNFCD